MFETLRAWFKRRGHKWSYRNPYDRTCKVCKRHQVKYSLGYTGNCWWETFAPGNSDKPCSEKD